MEKVVTICFETSLDISNTLALIAEEEGQSISAVVESIVCRHLEDRRVVKATDRNRRRFERRRVSLPAFIGASQWQPREFKTGTIIDISLGGIQFSVPKGTELEIKMDNEAAACGVIFTLPDSQLQMNVKCRPKRIYELSEEVQIGAALVNPDFNTYLALQNYLT